MTNGQAIGLTAKLSPREAGYLFGDFDDDDGKNYGGDGREIGDGDVFSEIVKWKWRMERFHC